MNVESVETVRMSRLEDIDLSSLEISDLLSEKKIGDAEDLATVMSASCTTCECCCSISSL